MKKRVHINSITAFHDVKDQFSKRQTEVLEVIWNHYQKGISSFDIASQMSLHLNSITGRINELMHLQAIRVKDVEYVQGRPRNLYIVRFEGDPLNTFSRGLQDRVDDFVYDMNEDLEKWEIAPRLVSTDEMAKVIRRTLNDLAEKHKLRES